MRQRGDCAQTVHTTSGSADRVGVSASVIGEGVAAAAQTEHHGTSCLLLCQDIHRASPSRVRDKRSFRAACDGALKRRAGKASWQAVIS